METNLKKLFIPITLFLSSIPLLLHGYLGYFSRYIADDFCSVYQAHRLGVIRAAWFWYLDWSGRFSASILDGMIGRLDPKAISFVVSATIMIWLIVLTALFMIFFRQLENRFLPTLALATTSLFVLFLLAPDIRQSLYWEQGMHSVLPPLILGSLQIILWSRLQAREWTTFQLVLWGLLVFLWALVTGGFSETYASFQVGALIFLLCAVFIWERPRFSKTTLFLASSLLGAICAMVIIILAPGNSERQAFYPPAPGILGIIAISLKNFFLYGGRMVDSPVKIAAILGLFGLAFSIGSQFQHKMNSRLLILIPTLTLGAMFLCFPPAAYGMSSAPPDRTLILPTYFFAIGLLTLGVACGSLFGGEQSFVVSKLFPSLTLLAILISVSIHATNLYQSRFEFIDYAKSWDAAEAKIREAKQDGATQVSISILPNWASLEAPSDNPKRWLNICVSGYYGLQVLTTTDPSPENP